MCQLKVVRQLRLVYHLELRRGDKGPRASKGRKTITGR